MLKLKNMNEKRFVDHDTSVENYVENLESKNLKEKTKRDVKLNCWKRFCETKRATDQEVQNIEPAELSKHPADFIRSVTERIMSLQVCH